MSPYMLAKTVEEIKARRVAIDAEIVKVRAPGTEEKDMNVVDSELYDFAEGQVLRSLIEAKMWYGKLLEALGTPFPPELADSSQKVSTPRP